MPFQLDTSIYAQRGAPPQQSPMGMLSDMLDMRAKQETLRGMQDQRDLINEQRQQAIDKVNREEQDTQTILGVYNAKLKKDPKAKLAISDFTEAGIDPERSAKIVAAHNKIYSEGETDRTQFMAHGAAGVLAHTPQLQQPAWEELLNQAVAQHHMTAAEAETLKPHPESAQAYIDAALTPAELASAQTSRVNADTSKKAEQRAADLAAIENPQKKAVARQAVRTELASRLQAAPTAAAYEATYNGSDPETRDGIPTPAQFAKNRKGALLQLQNAALTPEQLTSHLDSVAARAQAEDHFNRTEQRLKSEGGVTGPMAQSALKNRASDRQRLEEEKSRRADSFNPMTDAEYNDRLMQTEENYREELHLPPDPKMAEDRKQAALAALQEDVARRQQPRKDSQGNVVPGKGMPDAEVKARQLAIQNKYRSAFNMPPLATLPPEWNYGPSSSNAAPAAPGTLGALVTPQAPAPPPAPGPLAAPPQAGPATPAPPAPPAPRAPTLRTPPLPNSPAALNPQSASEAADVLRQLSALRPKAGSSAVDQQIRNLRDRYRVLTGT